MKKSLVFIVALGFFGANLTLPASAAIKAGTKCTSIGQVKASGSKQFICTKSGKKRIWKAQALEPAAPTSFENLIERYETIPTKVWNESRKLVSSGSVSTKFEIIIGPNTKFPLEDKVLTTYLENTSKLWSVHKQPSTTKVFIFSFLDLSWAQQKIRDLNGSWFTPQDLAMNCSSSTSCGAFGGTYMGTGQLFIGVPDNYYNFGRSNLGHEYTHAVQYSQFKPSVNENGYSLLPCWFSEGQPQVSGNALGFDSINDYKQSRMAWFKKPAGTLGSYSPESILRFFSLAGVPKYGNCDPQIRTRIYDVGYMAAEALASIKGINATMDVTVGVSQGLTFEDSFKKVYEISWAEAAPILSQVISKQFS
jgi:hypothetical protein